MTGVEEKEEGDRDLRNVGGTSGAESEQYLGIRLFGT